MGNTCTLLLKYKVMYIYISIFIRQRASRQTVQEDNTIRARETKTTIKQQQQKNLLSQKQNIANLGKQNRVISVVMSITVSWLGEHGVRVSQPLPGSQ